MDFHGNENLSTQDFFWKNALMIELTDIDTCLDIMQLREKYSDNPTALFRQMKLRTDLVKQHAPFLLPNTNIISYSMYTQSVFRFGKYYGYMMLEPVHEGPVDKVSSSDPHNILKDWLFDYFAGICEVCVQDSIWQLGRAPSYGRL